MRYWPVDRLHICHLHVDSELIGARVDYGSWRGAHGEELDGRGWRDGVLERRGLEERVLDGDGYAVEVAAEIDAEIASELDMEMPL